MAHQFEKKWRTQDVRVQENIDFSAMLLDDRILAGLTKAGFKKPSPIQLEAIPVGRCGKDLLVQAKSGTGKTLVFATIALEMMSHRLIRPQVLILAPTREIATQICSVVKTVGSCFPKLSCNSFIGGLSLKDDKEKAFTSQIVVGTPGRIRQLITLKALPTKSIRVVVFDEADKLLENAFKDEIQDIFQSLPRTKQVIATSATYPAKFAQTIMHFLNKPYVACLNSKELALLGIVNYAKLVKYSPMPVLLYRYKLQALEGILKTIKFAQCLLFCNGVQKVEVLYRDVKKWGFSATYISSAKEQQDRLKAIDRLKNFKCKVLVTSDVTARGIDAENVDLVINFDLSYGTETYLHRAGRAGRYGSVGVAITIVDEKEMQYLKVKEDEGAFKVYKLPDPVPSNLIQKPVRGEYFFENSESENSASENECTNEDKNNSFAVKNGKRNYPKLEKIKDKDKHASNETVDSSSHVSTEPTSSERIPVSEDDTTLVNDVTENPSAISEPEPKRNIKDISSEAENEKPIHVNDKAEIKEFLEEASLESKDSVITTVDFEPGEDKPIIAGEHPAAIKAEDELISRSAEGELISRSTEDIKPLDAQKEVAMENLQKGIDVLEKSGCKIDSNTESELIKNFNKTLKIYIETSEANEGPKVLQNLKEEYVKRKEAYETITDEDGAASKDEIITEDMLKALKFNKSDYFCTVFSKYLDDESESKDTCSDVKEQNKVPCVTVQDKDQSESVPKFSEKPNYESTPQSVDKQKCKESSVSFDPTFKKPTRSIMSLFQELAESSSDDTELSDDDDEVVQNSSSEDSSSDKSSTSDSSSSSSSSHSGNCDSSSSCSESCCSSCSWESLTDSDNAECVPTRKEKKFLASRHSERPVRSKGQHSQRSPKNFRNRKTKSHQSQSKFSNSHVCSVNCFLPSQHRYHHHHHHACNYGQAYLQWYEMFYYQWQHLQNAVFF